MKLTAGVNVINISLAHFAPIFLRQKITKPNITREKLLNLLLYEKHERKMLMKLNFFTRNKNKKTFVVLRYKKILITVVSIKFKKMTISTICIIKFCS